VEPLRVVDAEFDKELERLRVFDTFRDRLLLDALGEVNDRLDELLVGGVGGEVADELDVDFEVRDGESLEVGEAAEAGPEVVESDTAAQCIQLSSISAVSVSWNTKCAGSAPRSWL
jgi:hypothetical protein